MYIDMPAYVGASILPISTIVLNSRLVLLSAGAAMPLDDNASVAIKKEEP